MSEMINKTAPEGNVPLYLFRSGKNSHSYEYMGVHNTVKACFLFDHSLFGGENHFFELFGGDAQGLAFPFDDDDASFRYFLFQIDATDI